MSVGLKTSLHVCICDVRLLRVRVNACLSVFEAGYGLAHAYGCVGCGLFYRCTHVDNAADVAG